MDGMTEMFIVNKLVWIISPIISPVLQHYQKYSRIMGNVVIKLLYFIEVWLKQSCSLVPTHAEQAETQ